MSNMVIPWNALSHDALQGIIEDFVSREGTEYGERQVTLAAKVAQVTAQLQSGEAVVVFDTSLESASIVLASGVAGDFEQ